MSLLGFSYTNKTFDDILGLLPDQQVKDEFKKWKDQEKERLSPYTVKLDGKIVKAYGDIFSVDGQKSIDFETTYGDIISLKGKRKPKTSNLDFIIEYDYDKDNLVDMRKAVNAIEKIKKDRTPVIYSVKELEIEYEVTIETLTIRYKGVRDIYIRAELMEVYDNDNSNR